MTEESYRPVEPLEHDGVLSTEVISWEGAGLPAEPLISIGQVLSSGNICTELERKKIVPMGVQITPSLLT